MSFNHILRTSPRWRRIAAGALILGCSAARGSAQDPQPLDLIALGGFLGRVEGSCEDPGGSYDLAFTRADQIALEPCRIGQTPADAWPTWLGGALGASEWLAKPSVRKNAWVLITANNFPADFAGRIPRFSASSPLLLGSAGHNQEGDVASDVFWSRMVALAPRVVAMGREDFARALTGRGDAASALVTWLGPASGSLPFLASNGIVRIKQDDLNRVADGDYHIDVDEDASIGWLTEIKIEHPCEIALGPALATGASTLGIAATLAAAAPCEGSTHTEVAIAGGSLLPSRTYSLEITGPGIRATFQVTTHDALTPKNAGLNGPLAGLPVLSYDAKGPSVSGDAPVVIALVSPDARRDLETAAWQWTIGDVTREIDFLPPAEIIAIIRSRMDPGGQARRPFIIALSDLTDTETLALVTESADLRVVVLPPETSILGTASEEHAATPPLRRLAGDYGFSSILSNDRLATTTLVGKPVWSGETAIRLTATIQKVAAAPAPVGGGYQPPEEWRVSNPCATLHLVPGAGLQWRRVGTTVGFDAVSCSVQQTPSGAWTCVNTTATPLGEYALYPRGSTPDVLTGIWQDEQRLGALVRDSIGRAVRTDMVVLPSDVVDPPFVRWMSERITSTDQVLSRFLLDRALFRSYRIVRAYVPGSALRETLTKILDDPLKRGQSYCVSAITPGECMTALDKEHPSRLRINARAVDPNQMYTIALPDRIAEQLELDRTKDEDQTFSIRGASDRYFREGDWLAQRGPTADDSVAGVEQRLTRRYRMYFNSRIEYGRKRVKLHDPAENAGVRANLPISFSGASDETTDVVKVASEFSPLDMKLFAVRLIGQLEYDRRKQPQEDDAPTLISYQTDRVLLGGRFDWKFAVLGELRPYYGWFVEGPLETHITRLKASRPLRTSTRESATFVTEVRVVPNRFHHQVLGADVMPHKGFNLGGSFSANVSRLGYAHRWGTQTELLQGATIDGMLQPVDRLRAEGLGGVLNKYFEDNPDTFSQATSFDLITGSAPQRLNEFTLDGELVLSKKYKLGLTIEERRYPLREDQVASDFDLQGTRKFTAKLTFPVMRVEVTPSYEREWAWIRADANSKFQVERWDVRVVLPFNFKLGSGPFARF